MKYYWVHWPTDPPEHVSPFVVGVDKEGWTTVPMASGSMRMQAFISMKEMGLIIGPEIPGPPEEWRWVK